VVKDHAPALAKVIYSIYQVPRLLAGTLTGTVLNLALQYVHTHIILHAWNIYAPSCLILYTALGSLQMRNLNDMTAQVERDARERSSSYAKRTRSY